MAFKNDMTVMYAMHAAPRRELERIARVTAHPVDNPKHVLRTAAGWAMFKSYLQVHHNTEDDMLWPQMRQSPGGDSDGVALLDATVSEEQWRAVGAEGGSRPTPS